MFFLGFVVLSFFIIQPFFNAILTGMVIAYIFYPAYKKLHNKFKKKNLSAFIITILILLIIIVPTILILNTLREEAVSFYVNSKQVFNSEFIGKECTEKQMDIICNVKNFLNNYYSEDELKMYIESIVHKITELFTENITGFFITIPAIALKIFIVFFVIFFMLRDGKLFLLKIKNLLPLKEGQKKVVFNKFNETTYAVVFGSIIIAIIQGTIGGLGFFVLGIKNPMIWALIMMFFALVPFIGTPIVWLPASLFLLISGISSSDTILMIKGIILLLYGTFVISLIDNFLKPKMIGDRAKVHPVLVLLGVLGGINLFGFVGIIIGPVILALFVAFIKIYEEEKYF